MEIRLEFCPTSMANLAIDLYFNVSSVLANSVNSSGARIFAENYVNAITADALAPRVARSSSMSRNEKQKNANILYTSFHQTIQDTTG